MQPYILNNDFSVYVADDDMLALEIVRGDNENKKVGDYDVMQVHGITVLLN